MRKAATSCDSFFHFQNKQRSHPVAKIMAKIIFISFQERLHFHKNDFIFIFCLIQRQNILIPSRFGYHSLIFLCRKNGKKNSFLIYVAGGRRRLAAKSRIHIAADRFVDRTVLVRKIIIIFMIRIKIP